MNELPASSRKQPSRAVFVACTLVFFVVLLAAAESIGLVPYYVDGTAPRARLEQASGAPVVATNLSQVSSLTFTLTADGTINAPAQTVPLLRGEEPVRLTIAAIDLDLAIQNPATTDVAALDELLKQGPARYATSARLGERGNMIIFAHSSRLPIVHNKMYKAFNRISELAAGESIVLADQDGTQYLYRVASVKKVDAGSDASISLAKDSTRLTLVTCDTLTGKSARFVLDAEFIGII